MNLEGDQIAVSATDSYAENGERIYAVWLLSDDGEQSFESRIVAASMGAAVDQFVAIVAKHRLKQFSWKGPARGKLRVVRPAEDTPE